MTSFTNLTARLESLIGSSHVAGDPTSCADYAVDEIVPAVVAKPSSAEEAAEIVRFAALEKLAFIPCGSRTKLGIGMPPTRYDIALDMAGLSQIAHYDPGDLTLSAGAGMPIAKLNAALLEHKQFLPLLVPWYSRSTIGGTIASGVHSPLQQYYGTARDFLIGAEFVDGTGKLCKSGGRVVKNVTGYDLHKLLIGSLGSLAVITRLNFRTFPAPSASRGFVASFPTAAGALALRQKVVESPLTPLTLDVLSPSLAQIFAAKTPAIPEVAVFAGESCNTSQNSLPPIGDWFRPREWQLCAAFGGSPEVLDRYARDLTSFANESHATSAVILDDATRPSLWGRLRESLSMLLEASRSAAVFKLNALPARHSALFSDLQEIASRAFLAHALVARAGGTIYFALLPASANDESKDRLAKTAAEVFESVSASGGHAMLLFAPPTLKQRVSTRAPYLSVALTSGRSVPLSPASQPAAVRPHSVGILSVWADLALMRRLKSAFDPHNIFAPGRFLL